MRQVAKSGNPTTFLFTDAQIKQESFLEDINNILNTGEVPNIFAADEKADACELVRPAAKEEDRCPDGTPQQLFAFFLERCKKYLHIALCFSPIGDSLRNRIRDFPSIVNCTTIDYFAEWPPDALESVAQKFLSEVQMDDKVRQSCVRMVQRFHTTTQATALEFRKHLGRVYYVTPTSYLELINTFKKLLDQKRKEIMGLKNRYANGHQMLVQTETQVNDLQAKLIDMQPKIAEKKIEAEEQLIVVSAEKAKADEIRLKVAGEQADAKVIADNASRIRGKCQAELDRAVPIQKEAEAAVKCITKGDIAVLKKFASPPKAIRPVGQVLCMFFGMFPKTKVEDPETGKKVPDWWKETVVLLSDTQITEKLVGYQLDQITEKLVKDIKPFLEQESFKPEVLLSASSVASNLSKWIYAQEKCYQVNLTVKPLRADLAQAEGEYEEVRKVLAVKEAALKQIEDKVAGLQRSLQNTQDEVQSLVD